MGLGRHAVARAGAVFRSVAVVGLIGFGCEYPGDGSLLDDDDTADGGTGNGQTFQPTTGSWRVTRSPPLFNDCVFTSDPFLVASDFTLSATSTPTGGTSSLAFAPAIGPGFSCSLSGFEMACGEISVAEQNLGFVDTAGTVNVSVLGSFRDPGTLNGTFRGNISCVGIGCPNASTTLGVVFPCQFAIPFTGVAL